MKAVLIIFGNLQKLKFCDLDYYFFEEALPIAHQLPGLPEHLSVNSDYFFFTISPINPLTVFLAFIFPGYWWLKP